MVGGAYIVRHPPHASRVLLRLGGIVPVAGLVRGIVLLGAARVTAGTESPAGTGSARCIGRPWVGRGTGPGGIGRLGVGPSCGC